MPKKWSVSFWFIPQEYLYDDVPKTECPASEGSNWLKWLFGKYLRFRKHISCNWFERNHKSQIKNIEHVYENYTVLVIQSIYTCAIRTRATLSISLSLIFDLQPLISYWIRTVIIELELKSKWSPFELNNFKRSRKFLHERYRKIYRA